MAVPIQLRPQTVSALFKQYESCAAPLAQYFPPVPAKSAGPIVTYDIHTYSRQRGRINTRTGRPYYESGATETVVTYQAETWRDGIRIDPEILKDMRKPGSATENRANFQVADDLKSLRLRWEYFMEWMRAQALQGVKTFYPPGLDETYTELLLCSETCIITANAYDWSTASATEAAARTNLEGIRGDFQNARVAMAAVGCEVTDVIMNYTTRGNLDRNAMAAGIDYLHDMVLSKGQVMEIFGVNIKTNDKVYVHPITGVVTNYFANNVAVFVDGDNTRSGRAMVECEAVHVKAPAGHSGLFIDTWEEQEAPGAINVNGEWTGGPQIAVPCSQYVLTDVTTGP